MLPEDIKVNFGIPVGTSLLSLARLVRIFMVFNVKNGVISCLVGSGFMLFGTWWLRPDFIESQEKAFVFLLGILTFSIISGVLFTRFVVIPNIPDPPTPTPVITPIPSPIPKFTPNGSDVVSQERQQLRFRSIEADSYQITNFLKRYLQYLDEERIVITQPFSIQAGEVTVGEFRKYVNETNANVGARWKEDKNGTPYPAERPVENVSWQEAANYAKWLSRKTKWDLRLPTLRQWAAACVKYAEEYPNTNGDQPIRLRNEIDHLLGNLREWSAERCKAGSYYLLGENYMTDSTAPNVIGKSNCAKANSRWMGVGVRLVRIDR